MQPALGVVHAVLVVAAAIPAAWAVSALLSGWALAGCLVGAGLVLVLAVDILPRSMGRARPRFPAYYLSGLLAVAVRVGERATDLLQEDDEEEDAETEADEAEEIKLITSVLEFGDAVVREVMVPRADMVTVSARDDTDHALDVVIAHGRSRMPVTGESRDEIVGVLYARDLLALMDSGQGLPAGHHDHAARPTSCPRPSGCTTCSANCSGRRCTWRWSWTSSGPPWAW